MISARPTHIPKRQRWQERRLLLIGGRSNRRVLAQLCAANANSATSCIHIVEGLAPGKCLDIAEVGPVEGFDVSLKGTNNYATSPAPTSVIVTAGSPQARG